MSAIERVAAGCPLSKFKDDRHDWRLLMNEGGYMAMRTPQALYALRQCVQCKLTALLVEVDGVAYNEPPRKDDIVIYAFYPNNAPEGAR